MPKLLDKTVEAIRRLPLSDQDEIARTMLSPAGHDAAPEVIVVDAAQHVL